ncbi:MAG: dihydroxy-acid dehydratase [Chloroflexi bacterium]|nr:dihydroxy-acid dehydratase [Chloroflexota bacterium]
MMSPLKAIGRREKVSNTPDYMQGFRRALYRGAGFTGEALERPLVGVLNTWGEISPATRRIRELTAAAKAGVKRAGGTPIEFALSGLCDGTCAGASAGSASNYNLVWRDVAVAYIETVALANQFDALVLVAVCDEVMPACLLAAARVDIPSIIVSGGSMPAGNYRGQELWAGDTAAAFVKLRDGKIGRAEYEAIEAASCPGSGACGVMGTGNTMQAFAEAVGMILPGKSLLDGNSESLLQAAGDSGTQVMSLLKDEVTPRKIMDRAALENGLRVVMACGGSTCAVYHVMALAHELDLELGLEDFERLSLSTPFLCDVAPSGKGSVAAFAQAGGVPALMNELKPLLQTDCVTVSGSSLKQNLALAENLDRSVIRPLTQPIHPIGGISVIYGSLAPDGAVCKVSAVPEALINHKGRAVVFDSEGALSEAILAGRIRPGSVAVVRYAGPRGGPGMPCLYGSIWLLKAVGLDQTVALVTDGRMSGTIRGAAVAHVAPEAADGGPIALVTDGDQIEIDLDQRRVDLLVEERELDRRRGTWKAPDSKAKGILAFYLKHVQPSNRGAYLA